jgi:hypothetical protein
MTTSTIGRLGPLTTPDPEGAGDAVVTAEDIRHDRNADMAEAWAALPPADDDDALDEYTLAVGNGTAYHPRLLSGATFAACIRRARAWLANGSYAWAEIVLDGHVVWFDETAAPSEEGTR